MKPEATPLWVPNMALVGAGNRNAGKTTLACRIIGEWKDRYPVYAVKIIGIDRADSACARGGAGCGICSSLSGEFELIRETDATGPKDTALMLAAGAQQSYLLKSLKGSMRAAIQAFLAQIPQGGLIVCESNSLRKVVRPGVFLFAGELDTKEKTIKPSAREVLPLADRLVPLGEGGSCGLAVVAGPEGTLRFQLAEGDIQEERGYCHAQ